MEVKRGWIDASHPELSVARQCALVGLCRSSYYFTPMSTESEENLRLMRQIDELYLQRPFFGYRRMTGWLRDLDWTVNEKRVLRLMRLMGLQAVLPGPHTSRRHPQHPVYPLNLVQPVSNATHKGQRFVHAPQVHLPVPGDDGTTHHLPLTPC